jgi:type II secretory pathway pseudopilin PulG
MEAIIVLTVIGVAASVASFFVLRSGKKQQHLAH